MSHRFISETDIESNKAKLKEAWDATRGENDPAEPPEEPPPDNRSLFHRLEEQKLKKQEEYDDAHKLKNMVRGLEDDEVQFLDLVDQTKMEQEKKVREEEVSALSEFRKRRAEMELARSSELVASVQTSSGSTVPKPAKNSQKLLLSAVVKRKSDHSEMTASVKRKRSENSENGDAHCELSAEQNTDLNGKPADIRQGTDSGIATDAPTNSTTQHCSPSEAGPGSPPPMGPTGYLRCVGTLPGLGQYFSDSSDSENCSSDTDSDERGRRPATRYRPQKKKRGGGGCC